MRKNNSIFTVILCCLSLIAITSCSSSDSSTPSKDLFSLWNDTADDSPLDLTGGSLGVEMTFNVFFAGGEECSCDLTLLGTQSSGSWVLNSCSYVFGSGAADPGCNAVNDTGTYTNVNALLTIIDSTGDTDTYR